MKKKKLRNKDTALDSIRRLLTVAKDTDGATLDDVQTIVEGVEALLRLRYMESAEELALLARITKAVLDA